MLAAWVVASLSWQSSSTRSSATERRSAATMTSMAPPKIKLYTHTSCPFAQRVWIALEASELPFEKVEVNLCACRLEAH